MSSNLVNVDRKESLAAVFEGGCPFQVNSLGGGCVWEDGVEAVQNGTKGVALLILKNSRKRYNQAISFGDPLDLNG